MTKELSTKENLALFQLERKATLLKERIYATIILLAVLISANPEHSSAWHVLLLIAGTSISIWAASIVAAQMSRRIILKTTALHSKDTAQRLSEYTPLLAAGVLPTVLVFASVLHILPLEAAVNTSIGYCLLLMIGWSLLSARALHANKLQTLLLGSIELAIGLAIVFLKIVVGH